MSIDPVKTLGALDTALRDVSIEISEPAHTDIRVHRANYLIGEFRHHLRELFRTADGPMPPGWPDA